MLIKWTRHVNCWAKQSVTSVFPSFFLYLSLSLLNNLLTFSPLNNNMSTQESNQYICQWMERMLLRNSFHKWKLQSPFRFIIMYECIILKWKAEKGQQNTHSYESPHENIKIIFHYIVSAIEREKSGQQSVIFCQPNEKWNILFHSFLNVSQCWLHEGWKLVIIKNSCF